MEPLSHRLPDFPWDVLAPYAELARSHPNGVVDLSMGTPIDPVPELVQKALREASDAPGYPTTAGSPALREAIANYVHRRCGGVDIDVDSVLPTIGLKELVAWLPTWLGLGPDDAVVVPELAYPTYAVGAQLAGANVVRTDDPALWPSNTKLVWVNSPANPTGRVLDAETMARIVTEARARGAVVVSDECYFELGWDATPISALNPVVCGDSREGVLIAHSLSKRSNLAGYRAGFLAGDSQLIEAVLAVRKHSGMIVPTPVQAAMTAALDDDSHAQAQRDRYEARRLSLWSGLAAAGFEVQHSQAGLYLWVKHNSSCWDTVEWMASRGVLVSPGEFYGSAGANHVRVALTAPDERVAAAVTRLVAVGAPL
ncbi:MAG: succinyldiaminopimelate transaminase [Corynebacteriales bacterium]|nr:succinyldiaminopimelate transaminase [Mycobacteriales bacterium]